MSVPVFVSALSQRQFAPFLPFTDRVMQELEANLGLIQKVPNIKIVRSVAIYSLRFLRNLQEITGEILYSKRWATS